MRAAHEVWDDDSRLGQCNLYITNINRMMHLLNRIYFRSDAIITGRL